jgi:16S rRNA processing protein RimM
MTAPEGGDRESQDRDRAPDRIVVLGKIAGTFGVLGWVKVSSFTEPLDNLLRYPVWQLRRGTGWAPVEVRESRVTGKGVLAKLQGTDSPEVARLLIGTEIGVWRHEMPPTLPGEHYLSDLEGLEAVNTDDELLGTIDHFRSTPSATVAVVRRQGRPEQWVPFVKERIVRIDLASGRVVLDWPADL